jgi:DNA-binding CsgD family transcriptional regulator
MDVVGEAANGDEAVALVEQLRPNVVLMDLRMPKVDGIQATGPPPRALPRNPGAGPDHVRRRCEPVRRAESRRRGISVEGRVVGDARLGDPGGHARRVVPAEHRDRPRGCRLRALDGGWRPEGRRPGPAALAREREIVSLLGSGASNKEIADRLNLAEGTVKNHVTNILTKLDVRDRTQAALRARQLGIV